MSGAFVEQDFVVFTTKTSDLPGNPLVGTLQECMDKCINNSDCVAFSRQKDKKDTDKAECWLKKDIINNPKTANNSEWKTFVKQQEDYLIYIIVLVVILLVTMSLSSALVFVINKKLSKD
jgi:hypothetical protein